MAQALSAVVTSHDTESLRRSNLETLFDTSFSRVFRFFYLRLGDPRATEDLTDAVYRDLSRETQTALADARTLEARLFRAAQRRLAAHLRRRPDVADAAAHVRDEYLTAELREMLRPLRPERRRALELRCIVGLSSAATAAIMDTSEHAVRALVVESLQSLGRHSTDKGT